MESNIIIAWTVRRVQPGRGILRSRCRGRSLPEIGDTRRRRQPSATDSRHRAQDLSCHDVAPACPVRDLVLRFALQSNVNGPIVEGRTIRIADTPDRTTAHGQQAHGRTPRGAKLLRVQPAAAIDTNVARRRRALWDSGKSGQV